MSLEQNRQKKAMFKNPLLYSSAVLAFALLVTAWTFFSRWYQSRGLETREKAQEQRQRESDRLALEQFGGKELAIQNFYATPAAVRRGQSVQLCYGVANAKTVRLEPQPNPVWPSYSRCVDVTPSKTTTYTLTIADASGNTKSQSIEVQVR
jgi:hypothetical protein